MSTAPRFVPTFEITAADQLFDTEEGRQFLTEQVFPPWLPGCRWFGGKARPISSTSISASVPTPDGARLLLVEVRYGGGVQETYFIPLKLLPHAPDDALAITHFGVGGRLQLHDALVDEDFRQSLLRLITGEETWTEAALAVRGIAGRALPGLLGDGTAVSSRLLKVEQSNSSLIYQERVFVKIYRKLEHGVNPDAEILQFLGERAVQVPPFVGAIECQSDGLTRVLALATGMVANRGDAWAFTLRELGRLLESVHTGDAEGAAQIEADYLARARQLGERTGQLHVALASDSHDPNFAPEPLTGSDLAELATTIQQSAATLRGLFAQNAQADSTWIHSLATQLQPEVLAPHLDKLTALTLRAQKTRTHGDYHLGQVLETEGDFVILDFEGEPARTLEQRRAKRSPFRDVAGMLRSFHYAAHSALETFGEDRLKLESRAEDWHQKARQAFLESWLQVTSGAVFRDPDPAAERALLDAFLLEKALYEVLYEINNRPTWLPIPARGVLELLKSN